MMRARSFALLLILAAAFVAVGSGSAGAHPLGNFSINRFSGIEVTRSEVSIQYVVDMAEVPTFQRRGALDTNGDDRITPDELQKFAQQDAEETIRNLSFRADENEVALTVGSASARLGRGQGGLEVLRMEFEFTGSLPAPEVRLHFRDDSYPDTLGWREVVASASGGQGIADSDVPATSVSNELRTYPSDLLSSPLDVTAATVDVAPGTYGADSGTDRPAAHPAGAFAGAFSGLVERDPSPAFTGFAILVALLSGALHALGPGHGKTVMAAYLVGTAGRARHAIAVGAAVSLMHTASVIGLCLVTLWAQNLFAPEAVYPWLSLISGVVVLGLGGFLLATRLRRRRDGHGHTNSHGPNGHTHGAGHTHPHGTADHTHGHSPVSWRGLGALALSGGLLPSPAALVVLLGAVALGRVAFGLLLVLSFSVGLAAALTLIGILVLRARDFAARRFGRNAAAMPILSAAAIFAMGLFLTTRAAFGV